MKVTKVIDENTYEVVLEDHDKKDNGLWCDKIVVAHDYVRFCSYDSIGSENDIRIPTDYGSSNRLRLYSEVSFNTREMVQFILPYLNRVFKDYELTYTKEDGEVYEKYAYYRDIIYYRENDTNMVAIRMEGDTEYSHITKHFFDIYVKPTLIENLEKYENSKEDEGKV